MKKEKWFLPCMAVMLIIQLITIFYFCNLKQGFHYDEYYSYYSSNATNALFMPEMGWKDVSEIRSEFQVSSEEKLNYGLVNQMQSLDVHPPLYYFLLHTVCGLTKDIFSKWQGISINLVFFVLSWFLLAKMAGIFTKNKLVIASVCMLYGFSPAIYSGVTFIRMYSMLSFECLLLLYIHLKALQKEEYQWRRLFLPTFLLSFIGFYTHYYFVVFLFFVAAFQFLYLFFVKKERIKSFLYAFGVVTGMLAVVILYPSCLRHIFRGYRGTEAMDAFFSVSNMLERIAFFFDLMDEYAFGGMLFLLLLIFLLLFVTASFLGKRNPERKISITKEGCLIFMVSVGYFLVVAKTALMNAEEAIRYEMPIYAPFFLMMIVAIFCLMKKCFSYEKEKYGERKQEANSFINIAIFVIVTIVCLGQLWSLTQKKVCFLYERDKEFIQWASERKEATVAYIYNPVNSWMIWDESMELMQYQRIFFLSSEVENLEKDEDLITADGIYVYVMRGEQAEEQLKELCVKSHKTESCEKIRELLYCDLYFIH